MSFLSEQIIDNFIGSLSQEDFLTIESESDDEEAYKLIIGMYSRDYGANPSGTGIYLLRKKFSIGSEEDNRAHIPDSQRFF